MRKYLIFISYFSLLMFCMQIQTYAKEEKDSVKSSKSSANSITVNSSDTPATVVADTNKSIAADLIHNTVVTQNEAEFEKSTSIPWWIFLILIVLILVIVYFYIERLKLIDKNEKLKSNSKDKRIRATSSSTSDLSKYESENRDLKSKVRELELKMDKLKTPQAPLEQESISLPIDLKVERSKGKEENIVFYAGIASRENVFTKISNSINLEESVFKLTYTDTSMLEAKFEVLNTSELGETMKMKVTNSPDDYLYRICNNENSTSEFQNEIVTIKKGIAQKVGDNWCVEEENRALIKFE